MKEVVLDTETTGLNYKSGDRIIEVGCVELSNHVPTGKTYQFYCNVEKTIDEGARRVHGISNDFLKKDPKASKKFYKPMALDKENVPEFKPMSKNFFKGLFGR